MKLNRKQRQVVFFTILAWILFMAVSALLGIVYRELAYIAAISLLATLITVFTVAITGLTYAIYQITVNE